MKKKKPTAKPVKQTTKIKLNAMDVFRTADAASKEVISRLSKTRDGFDNFISKLGLNNDNTLSGGTYEFNLVTRNRILLEMAYRGSWIVGKVIDSVAEDMTRAGVDVTTAEADGDLPEFTATFSRLRIWWSLALLVKWGRLYGGAIGIMQIKGQDISTPLDLDTIAQDQFEGILVYDRWQLNPVLTPVIDAGPEMGLPKYYQIVNNLQSYDPQSENHDSSMYVHHSRIFRYTGIDLPFYQAITEMMWGESILERLWDRLISFDNASLSSAQLIDRANLRTVGIDGFREIIASGGEAVQGLVEQFDMMRQLQVNEGLTLIDKEDTFQTTAYSFAGLSDMMLQFGQQLAGAADIPLVRLFAQSPAGLNATGDSDIRMYYDNINSQQEAKLRNPFEVLIKVMWRSCFGKPAPKDLEFKFTPLWQMDAMDKANIAKLNTETIIGAHEAGLQSVGAAMKDLRDMSKEVGIFNNITEEEIKEAEELEPPMPDAVTQPAAPPEAGTAPAASKVVKKPVPSLG